MGTKGEHKTTGIKNRLVSIGMKQNFGITSKVLARARRSGGGKKVSLQTGHSKEKAEVRELAGRSPGLRQAEENI